MGESTERLLAFAELLLGAAHADRHFHDREREVVRELLVDLHGSDDLPAGIDSLIEHFDLEDFDLPEAAAIFKGDSEEDRKKILWLVGSVHEADEEMDLAEDEYLHDLAKALALPDSALEGLTMDIEVEDLRTSYQAVRKSPPPIPGKTDEAVDVSLDD